jgi:tRNA G26 N,N-dimethylase Trm1
MMTSTYSNTTMWLSGAPLDTGDDYDYVYPDVYGYTSPVPSVVTVQRSAVFRHGEIALCATSSDPIQNTAFYEWIREEYEEMLAAKEKQQRALRSIASECAAQAAVTFYRCDCCRARTYTQVDDGIRRCVICVNMVDIHEPEWGGEEVDELCCCNGCARGFRCDAPGMVEEYSEEEEEAEEEFDRAEYGCDYDW